MKRENQNTTEFLFADYDDFRQVSFIRCTSCNKYFDEDYNIHIRDWHYCPNCGKKSRIEKGVANDP